MTQEDLANGTLNIKKAGSRDLLYRGLCNRSTKQFTKTLKTGHKSFLHHLKKTSATKRNSEIRAAPHQFLVSQNLSKDVFEHTAILKQDEIDLKLESSQALIATIEVFFKDFFTCAQKSSAVDFKEAFFLERLMDSLRLNCGVSADQARFVRLDGAVHILTDQWRMSVTLSLDNKIKTIKLSTSSKQFFDKFSKTISQLKQSVSRNCEFDGVDFAISFEPIDSLQESKSLKCRLYGKAKSLMTDVLKETDQVFNFFV
jgi:hypothetical protein